MSSGVPSSPPNTSTRSPGALLSTIYAPASVCRPTVRSMRHRAGFPILSGSFGFARSGSLIMHRWSLVGLLAVLIFDIWLRCHTVGPTLKAKLGVDLYPVTGKASEPLDCDEA